MPKRKALKNVGDDLLKQNFPMIHAVGRAAEQPPRLLDLTWGRPGDPAVTLVGKGVLTELADRLAPGAHWVQLEPRQYATVAIVHRTGATLSPAAQVMVHLATRRIQEVIEPISTR